MIIVIHTIFTQSSQGNKASVAYVIFNQSYKFIDVVVFPQETYMPLPCQQKYLYVYYFTVYFTLIYAFTEELLNNNIKYNQKIYF